MGGGGGGAAYSMFFKYMIGKIYFTTSVLFFGVFVYHLYTARSASNFCASKICKILLLNR